MWINNISKIMFYKCMDDDKKEYRKLITEDRWIFEYCLNIKDSPLMYKKLKKDRWIYWYCKYVKDRKELWSKLTEENWTKNYCINIKDRPELKGKRVDNLIYDEY